MKSVDHAVRKLKSMLERAIGKDALECLFHTAVFLLIATAPPQLSTFSCWLFVIVYAICSLASIYEYRVKV